MSEEVKTTDQSQAPQQESADLTISDLGNIRAIIDLASTRGAFKPNEMIAVGTVYNKLNNFLNSVSKQQGTA